MSNSYKTVAFGGPLVRREIVRRAVRDANEIEGYDRDGLPVRNGHVIRDGKFAAPRAPVRYG